MAFSAAANSGYAPGSIASRSTRRVGGVRRQNESPDQFRNRMDAGYASNAGMDAPAMSPRAANITQARADGTFDAKRNAFNAANQGSFMDAAGNIGPKAPPLPGSTTPAPTNAPAAPSSAPAPAPAPVAPAKPKIPAGGSPPLMKPVGKIDGRPASLVLEGMKSQPPSLPASPSPSPGLRPPVTRTAGGELVQPGTPMNPNARWQKPALVTPQSVTPPATPTSAKPAGMVEAATPAKPYSGPMARPPGQVDAKPAAPTVTPATKPAGIVAAATPQAQPTQPKAETRQTASLPTANHSRKASADPSLEDLRQKADAAKAARTPGVVKIAQTVTKNLPGSSFVNAAQAVNRNAPAVAANVASGIKSAGDSMIRGIDKAARPLANWLKGSNQETPEEKAYREAMAKRKPATSQPAAKKQTPTFRTPYLPNRRTAFTMN